MKGKEKSAETEIPPPDSSANKSADSGDAEVVGRLHAVPSILKAVADLTRMRFVVIAKVTGSEWTACAVLDEMDFGLAPGGKLEVATTLCSEVRDHRNPILIENASLDPIYCQHPTPKKYGIESYIAVPITLKNGQFFGTLCAIDSRPADLPGRTILDSMQLFAELIANQLSSEEAYDALIVSETKRRESENRVRAVTDAMPGLISYIDREYRYQFVNQAYTEWFGLKAEDIINKPVWEIFGQPTFENAKPHLDVALEGRSETYESEITYRKRGTRIIRASYTPDILDGEVRGIFVLVVDISEEKLALEAVNRSEERYRAFITQSTEGIWRFELERPIPTHLTTEEQVQLSYSYGYLAECNDAMAKQYGFASAGEIVGARLSDLLVADDPKNVEFLKAFIESGYNLSEAESHEKDTSGNDRYFLNNFVGIVENGLLLRAWGTQRDITQTKLAGDATARLAAIVVSSEDAIISKDLSGNITSWNIGASKMFGYSAEEVMGKPISMLLPPDRLQESEHILERVRREENVEHLETVRRRRDGTDIVVSLTVSPIRSAEGQVIGASKIVRDITDRKHIEEAIHHNQMMLTLAMQSSRMGVWELDLATNTVSWSEELEAIFGLETGSFGGSEEHFYELMHEDDRDAAWTEVRRAVGEHRGYTIEFRFHHADGTIRWMEGRGEAVYSQKGKPVRLYGVGIDITERKEAEKALRDSERRLVLQEEISELIRTVSSPDELLHTVAASVGRFLQIKRALFNEIDLDKDVEIVHRDYCAEGVASVAGMHAVSGYSPVTSGEMRAGKTVVNADSKTDDRTAAHYERSYEPNGERAYVAIPLLRSGHWVASLWVSDDEPRTWLKEDVGMLETIAERTWAAVEKMRINAALRESQERFAKAFNSGPLVFTLSSLKDGRLIEVNDTFVQVTGYSRAEALGKTSIELGLWKKTADREAEMDFVRTAGSVRDLEYTFHTRDGGEIIGLLSAERIVIGGEPFALTVIQDITDRKRSQEALLKAERQAAEEYQALLGRIVPLAATLGRARDLTSIYRAVREFICASMPCSGFFVSFFEAETRLRHAAYVWGEGEEVDIAELPPMPLMPEGGGANSRAVFERRTIITNKYWDDMKNRPHLVIRQNGIDPMSSLIVPMMIKDEVLGTLEVQAHADGAFNDEHAVALEMAANLAAVAIENVRLIDTEAAAREAAEFANRAKDEFLSVLSHELRTPLNAMLGWVRMLKAGVLDEENSERALEVIERNTRLQGSLIEDLLDVSRIISGKMRIETELVDLVSVVKTASETIRPLADAKEVSYRFEHHEEAVFLTADSVRLQQVVSNLLQNAIKFTPAGGGIEISLARIETNAVLEITDTGVGIEAELLPHIFDRFRQADASARRNFTGLGLGLTIVRNIVELHGGSIDVSSDGKDKGSTFTLTLPLAADFYNTVSLGGGPEVLRAGSLQGKTILLVDDDSENLLPLQIFLEGERAEVTPAANAMEALKHLAERDFNLMITDIGMPEMDGYELVSRLRSDAGARNAKLNAIALTAYTSLDDRERALGCGFQAHLAKPVNFNELLSTIEKISKNGG
ncbi:MAG TPA: PAS domain S-box protein [Pyrinomonadaceae bacterium]|nr:PAS domain S-box protein [Pyrinomonadaceae bacterium]